MDIRFEVNTKTAFENAILGISTGLTDFGDGLDYFSYQNDPIGFCEKAFGETYTDDVKTLMISVLENQSTVARSANATGKSHAAARIAIWFFLCFPDSQVYTSAAPPESNLRTILWGEIGQLVERHKTLFKGMKLNDLHIERSKKSFITGLTIPTQGTPAQREARFSGKHAPNMLFLWDEGDAIPNECYRGAESCMSGGFTRSLAMFNPRHESGVLYIKEKTRTAKVVELSAFRHPNVVTGTDVYKGAVSRAITLRRMNEWTVPLIDDDFGEDGMPKSSIAAECYEVPDFLVGEIGVSLAGEPFPPMTSGWRKIIEPSFSYMVLGQYPAASSGQLISRAWINAARSRWDDYVAHFGYMPPKGVRPVLGLDVAEMGVDSNALCYRYGGYVAPIETWGGVDPNTSADTLADAYHRCKALFAAVDGTGVGAGVAPKLENEYGYEAYSVKMNSQPTFEIEQGEFTHMRDQLWWLTREWLRCDISAMLPPDEELLEELSVPTYANVNGKIKIMKKDDMKQLLGGRSPDRAESLILTFYNEIVESEDAGGALASVLLNKKSRKRN